MTSRERGRGLPKSWPNDRKLREFDIDEGERGLKYQNIADVI